MDKEYVVACPEEEQDSLFASVDLLNRRMRELREGGKVIGSERIAVMAALNIAHEFLEYKREKEDYTSAVDAGLDRIRRKLESALGKAG
ncbi:MAG: cell division protein ZapA [Gammaproteobacteria bacterium]|nr:MAG: cell division protein ZapA [Gammaproteobacteria bacterium]